MNTAKKAIRIFLHKLLGLPYRPPLTQWEIKNINSVDARIYICVDKNGLYHIMPGDADNSQMASAGRSLAYFIGREILDFAEEIQSRLKQLDQSNAPHRPPELDVLSREGEEEQEKSLTLLEEFEQEQQNENDEKEN